MPASLSERAAVLESRAAALTQQVLALQAEATRLRTESLEASNWSAEANDESKWPGRRMQMGGAGRPQVAHVPVSPPAYPPPPMPPLPPPPPSPPPALPGLCLNTCTHQLNEAGVCNEASPGETLDTRVGKVCEHGTDCTDCGVRSYCTDCPPACYKEAIAAESSTLSCQQSMWNGLSHAARPAMRNAAPTAHAASFARSGAS